MSKLVLFILIGLCYIKAFYLGYESVGILVLLHIIVASYYKR